MNIFHKCKTIYETDDVEFFIVSLQTEEYTRIEEEIRRNRYLIQAPEDGNLERKLIFYLKSRKYIGYTALICSSKRSYGPCFVPYEYCTFSKHLNETP